MRQISLSEIVITLDGDGFTKSEAMELSSKIVFLADRNELWLKGVAMRVVNCESFVDFKPRNYWQRQVTEYLLMLTNKERKCYLMHAKMSYSVGSIAKILNVSYRTVWDRLENAKDKAFRERPYVVTKAMLDALSPRVREVYLLRVIEGRTFKAIGNELGIVPSNVQFHFKTALRTFRRFITGDEEGEPGGLLGLDLQGVQRSRVR